MAATLDQTNIGTQASASVLTSVKATTAAVASGGTIFALVGRFNTSGGTLSMSGGGLTWVELVTSVSGSVRVSLFGAFAPAGLASATNVTVTASLGSTDITWAMYSLLGIDQSSTISAALTATNATAGSTTAWTSGNVAGASGNALIGGAWGDGTLRTSTPTSPAVERIDFNSATTSESLTIADKLSISGTDTIAGTWSGTLTGIGVGASLKVAAGGTSNISLTGIATGEAFSALNLKDTINLAGIATAESFSALKLTDTINLTGVATAENVPAVTLTGRDTANLTGIASAETFSPLLLQDQINLTGVTTGETFSPVKLLDQMNLAGIASAEVVPPVFQSGINLVGIPSAEVVPPVTLSNPNAISGAYQLPMRGVG